MSNDNSSSIEEHKDRSGIERLREAFIDGAEIGLSTNFITSPFIMVADKLRKQRQERLLNELARGEKLLTDKVIRSHEFVSAFMIIHHVVLRTRHEEKIKYFARLLLSGIENKKLDTDEFEEFVSILDDLSYREIEILQLLHHFEKNTPADLVDRGNPELKLENSVQIAMRFWDQFEDAISNRLGINSEVLISLMVRLQRTGLYRMLHGHWGDKNKHGETTALFENFISWIESEA